MLEVRLIGVVARRPAVPAAVLFILGIAGHRVFPHGPLVWVILLIALVIASLIFIGRAAVCSCLIAAAIAASGLAWAQLEDLYYPRHHIGLFAGDEPRLAWVEGQVCQTPRTIEPSSRGRKVPDKQVTSIALRRIRTWDGWEPAVGQMPVTISPPQPALAAGQIVRMLGRLERPAPAMNPGAFDAAEQARRQRVLASMHVSRPYEVQIVSNASGLAVPLGGLREAVRRFLDSGFDARHTEDRALLAALVFGDREPALRKTEDDFQHTGTAHLLAANGARVAMLAALVYLLARLLRLPPGRTLAAVTFAVAAFGLIAMPAAQAVRPILICAAVGLGVLGRRWPDSIQLLAVAALAILVLHPLDLYGAGFQLSFVIVLGMILLTRPLVEFLRSFEDPDKRVARSFVAPTGWRLAGGKARRWLIEASAAALVAWLVAAPLVAFHFEQFNLWTVPLSLLLSPFAALALACGFAKIALTAICPPLASAWASLSWPAAALLRHGVAMLARLPGADFPMPIPALWQILAFYGLLSVPLIRWPRPRERFCARCAPVGACVLLLAMPLCAGLASANAPSGGVRITLLSVGAGQCAVVEPGGGEVILLDAGSSSVPDPLGACLAPFLRYEQRMSVDSIWLSHGDYDHISAAGQIVSDYGVRQVLTSPNFRQHARESKTCEVLLAMLDRAGHSPRLVKAGDKVRLGGNCDIEVLWPPPDSTFNSNNSGLVLRLTCGGRSVLFPADIQEAAELELLKHPQSLRCDVLVAPHHGSSETTTVQFISAANPRVILSSNDGRLTSKQRAFDRDAARWSVYRTSQYGAITVEIAGNGTIRIVPFRGAPATRISIP